MPKYNYDESQWAYKKHCSYCGKEFYPINNENFCDSNCKQMWDWYRKDMESLYLNEWLRREEKNNEIS